MPSHELVHPCGKLHQCSDVRLCGSQRPVRLPRFHFTLRDRGLRCILAACCGRGRIDMVAVSIVRSVTDTAAAAASCGCMWGPDAGRAALRTVERGVIVAKVGRCTRTRRKLQRTHETEFSLAFFRSLYRDALLQCVGSSRDLAGRPSIARSRGSLALPQGSLALLRGTLMVALVLHGLVGSKRRHRPHVVAPKPQLIRPGQCTSAHRRSCRGTDDTVSACSVGARPAFKGPKLLSRSLILNQ